MKKSYLLGFLLLLTSTIGMLPGNIYAEVDNDGDAPSEAVKLEDQVEDDEANQSASKQEQLLVIGFDEKPKGVNPLSRLRSPGGIGANERSRQKPQMNIFNSRGGKTLGESSKNTAGRVTLEIS